MSVKAAKAMLIDLGMLQAETVISSYNKGADMMMKRAVVDDDKSDEDDSSPPRKRSYNGVH